MKRNLKVLGLSVMVMLYAASAHAISISLDDGSASITCSDGAACDSNPALGAVTYIGAVGSFNLNVTTGITFPFLGTPDTAELDLASVDLTSKNGGSLTIMVSQTDYTGPINGGLGGFRTAAGGTTVGTVSFTTFLDDANTLFGTPGAGALGTVGPFSTPQNGVPFGFAGWTAGEIAATGPFSLTVVAKIDHTGSGATSFDVNVAPVPEPATLVLMGSGLLGLGLWRRKK